MFNGIIFFKGIVQKVQKRPNGINIFIRSDIKLTKKDIGISVACDGVCLTLITIKKKIIFPRNNSFILNCIATFFVLTAGINNKY